MYLKQKLTARRCTENSHCSCMAGPTLFSERLKRQDHKLVKTRKHSSTMHTARFSQFWCMLGSQPPSQCMLGSQPPSQCMQGSQPHLPSACREANPPPSACWEANPPTMNRMTHRCKTLPCPKLRLRAVKINMADGALSGKHGTFFTMKPYFPF